MRCATTDLQHGRWKVGHWVMRQNFQMILVCVHLGEWKFQFQDCCRNLSILLHVDHLFWTFFLSFWVVCRNFEERKFNFQDCNQNRSILPRHLDHLFWTFFCNFGLFAAILKRRGNRCWAPPTIISLWWQLLLLCRKASYLPLPLLSGHHHSDHYHHHHYYNKFPQSSITFLFSMIDHPNQKATPWKKFSWSCRWLIIQTWL